MTINERITRFLNQLQDAVVLTDQEKQELIQNFN